MSISFKIGKIPKPVMVNVFHETLIENKSAILSAFLGTKKVLREMVEILEYSLSNQIFLDEDYKRLTKIQTKLVLQLGTFDDEDVEALKMNLPQNIREKELSKEEWKVIYRSILFFASESDALAGKALDLNVSIAKLIPEKAETAILFVKFNFYYGFHESFGPREVELLNKCNNKINDLSSKVGDMSNKYSELNSQSNELTKQLEGKIDIFETRIPTDSLILTDVYLKHSINKFLEKVMAPVPPTAAISSPQKNSKNQPIQAPPPQPQPKQINWTLVYRGTKDGFISKVFHEKCDNLEKPSIIIIKSNNGSIFGGFTSCKNVWGGIQGYGEGFVNDDKAFLFSLYNAAREKENPKNYSMPMIFPCKVPQNAIYAAASGYSCSFGACQSGGFELCICNGSNNTQGSYSNVGYCYPIPGNNPERDGQFILCGQKNFLTSEIEVYVVS